MFTNGSLNDNTKQAAETLLNMASNNKETNTSHSDNGKSTSGGQNFHGNQIPSHLPANGLEIQQLISAMLAMMNQTHTIFHNLMD